MDFEQWIGSSLGINFCHLTAIPDEPRDCGQPRPLRGFLELAPQRFEVIGIPREGPIHSPEILIVIVVK